MSLCALASHFAILLRYLFLFAVSKKPCDSISWTLTYQTNNIVNLSH